MAITVTHSKVSTIPDGDDSSLIRPSDWNDDHVLTGTVPVANGGTGASTLTGYVKGNGTSAMTASATIPNTDITGLGTMSTQNSNNISVTGGSISGTTVSGYIPTSAEGVANGVATLDSGGTVPLSQIPASIIGGLNYQGSWNASTNTPTLTSSVGTKGYYYVVSVAGTTNLNGITDWQVGDLAVFNGSVWQKIDNTDAVTSVNGYTGAVVLTQPDIAGTVPTSCTISTGTGLTGGGDLTANRTISFSTAAVGTWAATPSSANLAAAMTDETGSGSLVFGTGPTLNNPTISNYQAFTASSAPSYAAGLVWYDSATASLSYYNSTTNNVVHIGQELQQQARNSTGSTITKGQVVYISGATGQIGNITLAQANSYTASQVIGVANQDIPNNTNGWIVTQGTVTNINTSGLTEGANIYLSATTAGALTSTEPSTPNYAVHMGTCLYSNPNNGKIYICPINKSIDTGYIIGQIAIAQGGTNGTATPTAGAIAYGTGTAYGFTSTGTSGQVLTSAGSGTPTWTTPTTGTVTSITAGTGLSGGTITTSGTIALANTTVSAGSYTNASITVDAQGRLTSASSGTAPVTSVSGTTGRITSTGGTTPVIDLASGVATPGTTGSSSLIPVITIDTYGRVTSITTASNPQGTVTSVSGTGTVSGITLSGTVTSSGSLTLGGTLDLSSPPAIGGTTPNAITGTTITATKFVGVSGGTF